MAIYLQKGHISIVIQHQSSSNQKTHGKIEISIYGLPRTTFFVLISSRFTRKHSETSLSQVPHSRLFPKPRPLSAAILNGATMPCAWRILSLCSEVVLCILKKRSRKRKPQMLLTKFKTMAMILGF